MDKKENVQEEKEKWGGYFDGTKLEKGKDMLGLLVVLDEF